MLTLSRFMVAIASPWWPPDESQPTNYSTVRSLVSYCLCSRAPALVARVVLSPPGTVASSRSAQQDASTSPDPIGITRPHKHNLRPGRASPVSRGRGAHRSTEDPRPACDDRGITAPSNRQRATQPFPSYHSSGGLGNRLAARCERLSDSSHQREKRATLGGFATQPWCY